MCNGWHTSVFSSYYILFGKILLESDWLCQSYKAFTSFGPVILAIHPLHSSDFHEKDFFPMHPVPLHSSSNFPKEDRVTSLFRVRNGHT